MRAHRSSSLRSFADLHTELRGHGTPSQAKHDKYYIGRRVAIQAVRGCFSPGLQLKYSITAPNKMLAAANKETPMTIEVRELITVFIIVSVC